MNIAHIEKKGDQLLTEFGLKMAPVPVETIVTHFGIQVSYASSDEYSGILIRKIFNIGPLMAIAKKTTVNQIITVYEIDRASHSSAVAAGSKV